MKLKKYLLVMMAGLFVAAGGIFISCEEEEMEPYVEPAIYYVSKVKGYTTYTDGLGYEAASDNLYMVFDGINYPFCEYSIEIRKGSEKGSVVKSCTIKGEEIIDEITDEETGDTFKKIAEKPAGKTSKTWEGIPDFSKFAAYVVLTAVKCPEVTVEFDRDNSDSELTEDFNFYFAPKYEKDVPYLFYETTSIINNYFEVKGISKDLGNLDGTEVFGVPTDDMAKDYTLQITVDGVSATDVIATNPDGSYIFDCVDWKKFTYQQLDPSVSHIIRVAVKKI